MKKFFVACCMCVVSLFCVEAKAQDISQCDYDDFIIGSCFLMVTNETYSVLGGPEGNEYYFEGSLSDPFLPQLQKALAEAKSGSNNIDGKSIALLTSMDARVCATAYEESSLYIQPNIVEKPSYYVVGVCVPETSECWKLKIMKYSPAASQIRNGVHSLEGKIALVYYTKDKTVIGMYEDMNAD